MRLHTFEERLVSFEQKWECALGNVASDALIVSVDRRAQFEQVAGTFYPGYQQAKPVGRVLMLNLLLPGGCNAICPGICYTDWQKHRSAVDAMGHELLSATVRDFNLLGGKVIRIVGLGEPTLSKGFLPLCGLAADLQIALVVFSNGVVLPRRVKREYERNPYLYFYLKHWSDDEVEQNHLVHPKTPYRYAEGEYGPASRVLYDLLALDPTRVGLQVMVAQPNFEEVRQIIAGPKQTMPIFLEPFIPAGAGESHPDWVVDGFPFTKSCDNPARASYLAVVNQRGELQAGTFVEENAISLRAHGLHAVWDRAFTTNQTFFHARYHGEGCFCELMRSRVQQIGIR